MAQMRNRVSVNWILFRGMGLLALLLCFFGRAAAQQAGGQSPLQTIINGGPNKPFLEGVKPSWAEGLTITGLLQNTTGAWVNPHGIRTDAYPLLPNETATNLLATERNFMQVDTNYDPDNTDHFFLRFWGVYEPPYAFDQGFFTGIAGALNRRGNHLIIPNPATHGHTLVTVGTASSAAQYYNRLEFREAWWRGKHGPFTLFLGRQIVTWGESLAFRVGDVVNPQDLSWGFGFANLEQSRIPLWMVHPVVRLPDAGVFESNYLEAIWVPAWQPVQNNWVFSQSPAGYYQGRYGSGDLVSRLPPFGGRFQGWSMAPYGPPGPPFGFPAYSHVPYPQGSVVGLSLPPTSALRWSLPADTWQSSEEGVRLESLVAETWEVAVLYWHGHQYLPALRLMPNGPFGPFRSGIGPDHKPIDFLNGFFPQLNDIGVTGDRPVSLPGHIGEMLPLVMRAEGVWQDRTPFATFNRAVASGVQFSSTINTLMALDLDNMYAPWLTSTGTLTTNLEWNNYTIMSPSRYMEYAPLTAQRLRHNEESILLNVSTSWWWQSVTPQWIMVYNPDGNTFLLFPNLLLVPPWTSNYFLKLQFIGILSGNRFDTAAASQFKGKNFVLAQFQWNFNLL